MAGPYLYAIQPVDTQGVDHVAFCPTMLSLAGQVAWQVNMVSAQSFRGRGAERDHCYETVVMRMLPQNDNGPLLDHLRGYETPEVADENTRFLGLVE